ncbi:MAG: 4-hydroxy-3-methylbut-2-enyl diphosphate reductase [Desulfobacteraceae bacterium]
MKITVAKTAGFCMGVRRAVDLVLDAANTTTGPIYTYGPLIHNPQVLDMLESKGIKLLDRVPEKGSGTVLIRAHGVPPQDEKALQNAGFEIINATCPRVIKVQSIIRKHAEKGFGVIIIGDKNHPEVTGLLGYAGEKGYTVSRPEEIEDIPLFDNAVIVAQTTQDTSFFRMIRERVKTLYPHYKIYDTICDSTEKRQAEIRDIAQEHDAVIVIGGKTSGNTRRLAQIAQTTGKPCSHVEDPQDLDKNILSEAESVAVTAGASTPNWIITKTCRELEKQGSEKGKAFRIFTASRDFLLHTNIMPAAGAGCLTYASAKLQNLEHFFYHSLIAVFYVLSMQILNNLLTITSDTYNNPERAALYRKNFALFAVLAIISGAAGLYLAFLKGAACFAILLVMSILGLSYNLTILPGIAGRNRIRRIKDIPGSKTILIAVAWGIVTSILPAVSNMTSAAPACVAFLFTAGLVFSRTALFDVIGIQGDRINGKETLPIIIGEKKSITMIKCILIFEIAFILASSVLGITMKTGFIFAILPAMMVYFTRRIQQQTMAAGPNLSILMEGHFIVAGGIALMV